ncbi:MAG TPA: nucleotidyltransferase family protein, partial [Nitrososphaerales archaeon]|nr:nucleotidyltransferase family protein [Nitrososphaerales archaeon]
MKVRTQAAVLCGGRGERLKPLTDYFQKVMIPMGPKKQPLLAYIIDLVTRHNISDIALLTGYRSQDIRDYFQDGSSLGVRLTYSEDPRDRKGSLNAASNALANGAIDCEELVVYYGDVLMELDIGSLLKTHRRAEADATLVLARKYTLPVGIAEVSKKDGMVSSFREKPEVPMNVTTGCMVLGPRAMKLARKIAGKTNTDLMTHLIPALLKSGGRV